MRLNPDCVRSVLLEVEASGLNEAIYIEDLCNKLPEFTPDDIQYTCAKLIEAEYLNGLVSDVIGSIAPCIVEIWDLTYEGHEFLDTVRPTTVWEKTKGIITSIGSASLPVIQDAAKEIAIAMLTAKISSEF